MLRLLTEASTSDKDKVTATIASLNLLEARWLKMKLRDAWVARQLSVCRQLSS